jgi:hypothetical protein
MTRQAQLRSQLCTADTRQRYLQALTVLLMRVSLIPSTQPGMDKHILSGRWTCQAQLRRQLCTATTRQHQALTVLRVSTHMSLNPGRQLGVRQQRVLFQS